MGRRKPAPVDARTDPYPMRSVVALCVTLAQPRAGELE
jgi:hypothetical protein